MNPKSAESWLGLLELAFRNANAFYSALLLALAFDITLTICGQSILQLRWSTLNEAVSPGAAILCALGTLFLIHHSARLVQCVLSIRELFLDRMDRLFRWLLDTPDVLPQPPCRYTVSLDDAERHASKTTNVELAQKVKDVRGSLVAKQTMRLMGARLSVVCLILILIELGFPNGTFVASGEYRGALWLCLAFIAAVPLLELRRRHIQGDGRIECPDLAWALTLEWYADQGREPPGLAYRAGVMERLRRTQPR
ncbi:MULTISPECIES: hypothetical protein [unclassified Lysobacter]|uniref:hypothetical protein n=1 Tax=unclassified Lysobacter TaxID=2635362 RepID=UPI001BEC4C63|nr:MULTISPECIES: hypothetical protein [unclassified Lysobacter]MBT2750043.1 hypothetical protein [Lysobacter sp. ISL-50]MBT2775385.1 hypothetical protein [Lysobacter sp. ISL-54]MBT2783508.1 hypothetical protein [Lysobacter sp. ISL-52]